MAYGCGTSSNVSSGTILDMDVGVPSARRAHRPPQRGTQAPFVEHCEHLQRTNEVERCWARLENERAELLRRVVRSHGSHSSGRSSTRAAEWRLRVVFGAELR
jgi:hypothetical protein